MATIRDYNTHSTAPASVETVAKLISEPSDEWLQSYGKNFQELDTRGGRAALSPLFIGKFIAIHDLVYLAPFTNNVFHATMFEAARLLDGALVREKRAEMRELGTGLPGLRPSGEDANKISDGGYFKLSSTDGTVTDIILEKESSQFGRADEAGREKSAEYVQRRLDKITATVFKQRTFEDFLAQMEARRENQ